MKVVFHYDAGPGLAASLERLGEKGLEVDVVPVADRKRFARALKDCEVLWHVLEPVTGEHIRNAPKLRLIQKIGVGVNTIDLEIAKEKSVAVCNMPGTNSQAVSEMTLLLLLSALRRASLFDRQTRCGEGWNMPANIQDTLGEISGKVVGFVGFGEVPNRLTPVLKAMGARVLYTATSPKETKDAEWRELNEILRESDIISLHIPLTDSTANLIDANAFQKMKPGAVLVNTARGGLVDQRALIEALTVGRLRAAGLDVFAEEPISTDDPLLKLDNVTLAPHVSWLTLETLERSIAVAVENCQRLQNGKDLLNCVVKN
jgi:phosphoglycerate dehydrogenase-like enzyme